MKRILTIVIALLAVTGSAWAQKAMTPPHVMVVPDMIYCKTHGYVRQFNDNGTTETIPDYEKAMSEDPTLHSVLIQVAQLISDRNQDIEALPQIIDQLQNRGYTFVTVSELLASDPEIPEEIAAGNVTMHDIEQTDQLMRMRRIGDLNVLAWATPIDTIGSGTNFRVKSYGMDGKAKDGTNTSIILNNVNVDDFRIVPDLEAQSLNNVALLWREIPMASDSTSMRLMAARLVPNKDGGFGIGTPMTTVRLPKSNNIFGFDGYMTNEKIQVCYVAVDSLGVSQLNKTVSYFGNAFNYTIQFDSENNQGFQCNADEITLLVTVNNYGTSNISECVLKIDGIDKPYPINTTINAGSSVKQRITIPYILGTGVNTTMYVKYDDILGVQEQSYARYLARRAARIGGRKGSTNKEDHVYEQHTRKFYPYSPRFECFVAGQRVDKTYKGIVIQNGKKIVIK